MPCADQRVDGGLGRGHLDCTAALFWPRVCLGFSHPASVQIEAGAVEAPACLDKADGCMRFSRAFPPFTDFESFMHRYRTHTCGALRDSDIGKDVRLSGWCHRIRDHGGVLFIDLRDHYGLTQVVADPDSPAFKVAETLRAEWVVRIDGKVRRAPERHRERRPADRRGRGLHHRDRGAGAGRRAAAAGVRRSGISGRNRLKYRFLDLRREQAAPATS